jgi:hypothetical protein
MKKKLATTLTKWALKLNPEAAVEAVVPVYENYEATAIGVAQEITKNDLRKYKRESGEKSSRKAIKQVVDDTIRSQANRILNTAHGIIEVSVYKKGDSTVVESRLNVYVKKGDSEPEGAEDAGESRDA